MDSSMPGLPVHHQLLELAQTHVHRFGDAIQPSHPLSSPSPPAPNPSQHQGLFQCIGSSHQVAKVKNIKLIFSKRVNPKESLIHLISHNFKYIKENILDTLCPRHPVTPLRSLGGMKLPLPPKVIKVGTLGCQEGHCPVATISTPWPGALLKVCLCAWSSSGRNHSTHQLPDLNAV